MNWKDLTIGTLILYAAYYLVVIIIDTIKSKKIKKAEGYEVVQLDFDDDEAQTVYEENYFNDDDNDEGGGVGYEKEEFIVEKTYQALPVDEFLKNAKNIALGIEF